MITGQLLVYHYNGLHNAKEGVNRNIYSLRDVRVNTPEQFRESIADAMDEVPAGRGYVLVKWSGRCFICEKDSNHPEIPYVRHEILYHPFLSAFSQ